VSNSAHGKRAAFAKCVRKLDDAEYRKRRAKSFGSIHRLLNHNATFWSRSFAYTNNLGKDYRIVNP
jgi:uncharacterized damage-inducible protein DinB